MTCTERKPDLLLLAHGELLLLPRLRLENHLRRCPACREYVHEMTRVSSLISDAARAPGQPSWQGSQGSTLSVTGPVWLAAIVLILVLVISISLFVRLSSHHENGGSVLPQSAPGDLPCRPDLPNGRCR